MELEMTPSGTPAALLVSSLTAANCSRLWRDRKIQDQALYSQEF